MKVRYIHAINNKAASWQGNQICYAGFRPITTELDLSSIKRQRRASAKWRKQKGFTDMNDQYGHFRVLLP